MSSYQLIRELFTAREIAKLCGISVQAVYKWKKSGVIPAEYCLILERACDRKVTRYQMRFDVFGTPPKECVCNSIHRGLNETTHHQ